MRERPKSMSKPIAVIVGASPNRAKFANKSVRAHQKAGYEVYVVHPRGEDVEGAPAFTSIAEVPGEIDRVSVYLPPAVGLAMLDEIAERRPAEVWLNPGAESAEIRQKGESLGLNLIEACSIVDVGFSPSQFPE